jgi:hypothetical protein
LVVILPNIIQMPDGSDMELTLVAVLLITVPTAGVVRIVQPKQPVCEEEGAEPNGLG